MFTKHLIISGRQIKRINNAEGEMINFEEISMEDMFDEYAKDGWQVISVSWRETEMIAALLGKE